MVNEVEQLRWIWHPKLKQWVQELSYVIFSNGDDDNDAGQSVISVSSISDDFATDGYKVTSPAPSIFPTSVIWYTDSTKTKKIIEKDIVWTMTVPTQITWRLYQADGITVAHTVIDTIFYNNHIFEHVRIRETT